MSNKNANISCGMSNSMEVKGGKWKDKERKEKKQEEGVKGTRDELDGFQLWK